MKNQCFKEVCLIFTLTILAFGFVYMFANSIHPYIINSTSDSAVFQQMGLAVSQGKVPYADLFDHKGFLLYCIEYVGLSISAGHWGLYLLFSICVTITCVLEYKIARLFLGTIASFVPVLVSLACYTLTIMGGNLTEDWSLPFITYSLYVFSRFLINQHKVGDFSFFCIGLCMGAITHLRINNMIPICCVYVSMGILLMYRKQYSMLLRSCLLVLLGWVVATGTLVLVFVGLYGWEHLWDLWFGTIGYNVEYMLKHVDNVSALPLEDRLFATIMIMLLLCQMCVRKDYKDVYFWFIFLSCVCCTITMGKAHYPHYLTILVPFVAMSSISILSAPVIKKYFTPYISLVLVEFLVLLLLFLGRAIFIPSMTGNKVDLDLVRTSKFFEQLSDSERRSIWNYNAHFEGSGILQANNIVQCNRIILHFQTNYSNQLYEPVPLIKMQPEWIMMRQHKVRYYAEGDSAFIANNYRCIFGVCRYSQTDSIFFYKKYQE